MHLLFKNGTIKKTMKRHNKTTSIADLLDSSVFGNVNLKNKMNNVIKHSTIFSFWNNIVGVKFARHTKPYAIKTNKLYVSVKSPAIAQELSLYKLKLLKKINSYSMPLNMEIKDVIFNYKNFSATTPETLVQNEDKPIELEKQEIDNIVLDEKTKEEFKNKIEKLKFLNDSQKNNLLSKLLDAKKAQIIQNKNN